MNMNTMTTQERERLAYAEGFTEAAKLLARIDELEIVAGCLLYALDTYVPEGMCLGDEVEIAIETLRGTIE
jgi:hypothetical protein